MENENTGENSKKKNSDISDNDRPLKKAKYLWQVKGKYHLKENNVMILSSSSADKENETSEIPDCKIENNVSNQILIMNNNTTQARNKNICSDRSCIEALIANSDKIMDFPEPESPKCMEKSISDEIPITLVKPNPKNEDYYLRKWQARQIAKGFVDNTINRVLESWMVAPFDAADFVENCDNGGQIEDEGILMAIQSHGLQSGTRDVLFPKKLDNSNCTCSKIRSNDVSTNPLTPFHRRSEDFTSDNIFSQGSSRLLPNKTGKNNCTCFKTKTDDTSDGINNDFSSRSAEMIQSHHLTSFHRRNDDSNITQNDTTNIFPSHQHFDGLSLTKNDVPSRSKSHQHFVTSTNHFVDSKDDTKTSQNGGTTSRPPRKDLSSRPAAMTPQHRRSDDSRDDFTLNYYENLCILKDTEPLRASFFRDKPQDSSSSVETESSMIDDEVINDYTAYEPLKMNDTDFLDAAVAVAIQKKGLTSCSYVDCG